MRRSIRVLIAALTTMLPAVASAQMAERDVFVTVIDAAGTPIRGLSAADFAVREDDTDRGIVRVEPSTEPMHVAVLVDTSLGANAPIEAYRSAVSALVAKLAIAHHVALYSFGQRALQVVPYTQDGAQLRDAVASLFSTSAGGSLLVDAVDLAAADLAPLRPRRPVIVAVSTENPEVSRRSPGSVVKRLVAQSAAFHAVVLRRGMGTAARTGGRGGGGVEADYDRRRRAMEEMIAVGEGDRGRDELLKQGTELTGGSLQAVTSLLALEPALTRLTDELAAAYRLTFERPARAKVSKNLQTGVMLEGVTVRATIAPLPR